MISQVGRPRARRGNEDDDGGSGSISIRRKRSNDSSTSRRRSTGNPVGRPKKPRIVDGVEKPRRQRRRPRDPAAPKRPQNAFLQFCQEQRPLVHTEYERDHGVKLGKKELTKVLGQRWSDLAQESKRVYHQLFEKEKEKYQDDMTKYKQQRQESILRVQ